MKLIEHFNSFLRDEVNLNQSRIDLLETRVAAIADFVRSCNPFGDHLVRVVPQGSWQHRTIIKPHDITDDDILERPLALNLERAGKEGR